MREPGAAAFYLPWLDGLRAAAALLVLVSHSAIFPGRSGEILSPLLGSFGVYVFLTLSAFLLTRLLRLEWQSTGRLALGAFWVRRALRIWPLYVVWCLFMAGWALWAGNEPALRVLGQVLAHLTFTEDFTFPLGGWAAALPYSAQLWTISLEEQAYFLLPLVLSAYFAAGGCRRLRTILIAIAAAGAAVRLGLLLLGAGHVAVWVSPLHPDAFLAGLWLGLQDWPGDAADRARGGMPWLVLGAALVAAVALLGPPVFSIWAEIYAYPAFAAAALAVMIGIARMPALARLLGAPALRYLGRISYGIYTFHFAALAASDRLLQGAGLANPVLQLALALLITVAAADLSYRGLERPFLKLKARFTAVQSRPI